MFSFAIKSIACICSSFPNVQVSVDIRSPLAGVMVELCAKQGDTVQVGAQLFKIDSDGKASVASSAAAPAAAAPAAAKPAVAAAVSVPVVAATHAHTRVPLIQFKYGKRGLANLAWQWCARG